MTTSSEATATAKQAWDSILTDLFRSLVIPHVLNRVLLWGPPRTGKSTISQTLVPGQVERVTMHREQPVDDLLGGYCLKDGSTVWADGPAVRAMRRGHILVLDEVDKCSPENCCVQHALMDDPAAITLASGERVIAQPGYAVIATTNALPSALSPAIYDRFDLILKADTLSAGLQRKLGNLAAPAQNTVARGPVAYNWSRPASVNLFIAAAKLRSKGLSDETIASVLALDGKERTDFLLAISPNV